MALIGSCLFVGTVRADSTDVLIRALGGGDLQARAEAIQRLAGRGPGGVPDLEKVVADGSWWAREGALEALAGMGETGLPTLARVARSDEREEVRRFAARVIGRIRRPAGREVLVELMKDARVRGVAAAALGEMGDSVAAPLLIRALGDRSLSVRRASAVALGKLRDPRAVGPLVRLMADSHQSVRFAAAGALAGIGPSAAGALSGALRQADPLVRALAAEVLGRVGGPEAVSRLLAAAEDGDWGVRGAVARALGLAGAPPILPELNAWLGREPDRFVAAQLRGAIQRIGEK
ncbi:MAG: HEAT repeat domain-containing protein [Candidatus Latescibacteria bacterium]|nr:HEAT repeat domain-containing protein [Candidatus Latescibacterota bacterium]